MIKIFNRNIISRSKKEGTCLAHRQCDILAGAVSWAIDFSLYLHDCTIIVSFLVGLFLMFQQTLYFEDNFELISGVDG